MEDKICSTCKTGADALKFDPTECFCPYIIICKGGKCPMYKSIFKNIKDDSCEKLNS